MSDLISRADAIEEISKGVWNVHELIDRIKTLPSAKYITEKPNDAVKASNDVINRADAIDAVHEYFKGRMRKSKCDYDEELQIYVLGKEERTMLTYNKGINDKLRSLPSAEQHNKDAISREGLLRSWEELSPRGRTEFDQVIMTIPALPSADTVHGEWMPCSERLPIPPMFCLVTTDGSHGDVIDIALYMSDGWHKASEVIAWMPLPTPYKGGDEE